MEGLDLIELFARANELDGLSCDGLDRKRSAASRVAVELREHHAVNVEIVVECLRGIDRVLAGHRVDNEENFVGFHRSLDRLELVHERLVDVQAARSVQKYHVVSVPDGVCDRGLRDIDRVRLPHLKDGDIELTAHDLQLLDGRRTVNVAGDEQRIFVLLFEKARKFRAVCRFARALKTDQHYDCGRLGGHVDFLVVASHERRELFVHDLHDHLRRSQALEHIRADRALGGFLDKVLDDLVADVGL